MFTNQCLEIKWNREDIYIYRRRESLIQNQMLCDLFFHGGVGASGNGFHWFRCIQIKDMNWLHVCLSYKGPLSLSLSFYSVPRSLADNY